MTTIRDVARISGYSVSTVSRVLNHKNYVSDEVRQAIQQVINQLDYAPSDMARDLSRGQTMTIGVVLPRLDHPYFSDLSQGILAAAFANDYNVEVLQSKYIVANERFFLEQMRRKAFDGLIFTSHTMKIKEMLPYQKYGHIVVCHDPGFPSRPLLQSERRPMCRRSSGCAAGIISGSV